MLYGVGLPLPPHWARVHTLLSPPLGRVCGAPEGAERRREAWGQSGVHGL